MRKLSRSTQFTRRTPHGVRGLKFECEHGSCAVASSHPAWGAWIEIFRSGLYVLDESSHPAWGAWIEIPFLLMSLL